MRWLLLLLALTACEDQRPVGTLAAFDAGTSNMSDATAADAGTVAISDAGLLPFDAGSLVPDAGSAPLEETDAGAQVFDAGPQTPFDAGLRPLDAGPQTPFDAGPFVFDAGTLPVDAGVSSADAGSFPLDAGPGPVDAGSLPLPDAGDISFPTLRVDLPCIQDESGNLCTCALTESATSTLNGDPDTIYEVTIRVRGVSEERLINGGVESGPWCVGGTVPDDTSNIWQLTTSNDSTVYYLNVTSDPQDVFFDTGFDYQETLQLSGGTTLTLLGNSRDSQQLQNHDDPGNPIVVPGIPPAPVPYDGSFIQIDCVSAEAQ